MTIVKKESLVKYLNDQIKPKRRVKIHPVYSNSPDYLRIIPGASLNVLTGLEINLPTDKIITLSSIKSGLELSSTIYHGKIPELTIELQNNTGVVVEIEPFEQVAEMYLLNINNWEQ